MAKYKGNTLPNGLFYTDDDILCSYRDAKDKRSQLKILAEMNLCTTDDIREALMRAGMDGRSLPRKSKKQTAQNNKPENKPEEVTITTNDEVGEVQLDTVVSESTDLTPSEVLDLAHNAISSYRNMLLKQKKALEREISNLENRMSRYRETLAKCDNELEIIGKLISNEK